MAAELEPAIPGLEPDPEPRFDTVHAEPLRAPIALVPFAEFVAVDEAAGETLIGVPGEDEEALLAADSVALWYGDAGASKTTLSVDLAAHAAAGTPWLGLFPIARPLTVALLENEGSRARFRQKLRKKQAGWEGPPFAERVYVYSDPWGEFSFALEDRRAQLAAFVNECGVDLLFAGPLAELGAKGAGTPDDVGAFGDLLADFRRELAGPLALVILHHENKSGDVSGAWGRLPGEMIHVRLDGRERTLVTIRKARHSSRAHGAKLALRWLVDREGFEVVESDFGDRNAQRAQEELDALAWLAGHVAERHAATGAGTARGNAETAFHEAHGNHGRNLARRVIDSEIALAAAWLAGERTGEDQPTLAAGPGEVRNGTYLFPFSYAPSPLAAPLNGEGGEEGDFPSSATPPRQLAADYKESGERRGRGDGGESRAQERAS